MKKIVYGLLAFAPVLALAQGKIVDTATSYATGFNKIINILIPAFFGLAVVYFFYGLAKYLLAGASDPKAHDAGKQIMIWGVIALAIMGTLYGLINFLADSLGVSKTGSVNIPGIPAQGGTTAQ
jgi:hypothetical protein